MGKFINQKIIHLYIMSKLPNDLDSWADLNIKRGCCKRGIFKILLDKKCEEQLFCAPY